MPKRISAMVTTLTNNSLFRRVRKKSATLESGRGFRASERILVSMSHAITAKCHAPAPEHGGAVERGQSPDRANFAGLPGARYRYRRSPCWLVRARFVRVRPAPW